MTELNGMFGTCSIFWAAEDKVCNTPVTDCVWIPLLKLLKLQHWNIQTSQNGDDESLNPIEDQISWLNELNLLPPSLVSQSVRRPSVFGIVAQPLYHRAGRKAPHSICQKVNKSPIRITIMFSAEETPPPPFSATYRAVDEEGPEGNHS